MTDGPLPWNDPDRKIRRSRMRTRIASYIGLAGALVGFIDGIVLWADGARDWGIAIWAISLSVGAVVVIFAHIARSANALVDAIPRR